MLENMMMGKQKTQLSKILGNLYPEVHIIRGSITLKRIQHNQKKLGNNITNQSVKHIFL